ncbi:hypothetical protein GH714_015024 [Hevea brasiliensis]|uniref:Phospholipid/glycerol acyltransferase domain-containing protein n=1 Tax=Hevea brasiliensis TaxID=3981 RepID=A0A6A6NH92_HEVBR|nr:hypothetical protein GH714_015024 [Hevea brasiliensis]
METELKDENTEPSKRCPQKSQPEVASGDASTMDDLPLLKSDSNRMSTENIQELEKKFAAFVRNDVYGTMGRGELPICTLFSAPNRDVEKEQEDFAYGRVEQGRDCENEGKDQSGKPERPGAIISNHVSYLDFCVTCLLVFQVLSPRDQWPNFLLLVSSASALGVYVQRELKSSDFKGVAGVVTERVREANQNTSAPMMMLFPEGTTTNGDFLLPFKRRILSWYSCTSSDSEISLPKIQSCMGFNFWGAPCDFSPMSIHKLHGSQRLPVYYPSQEEKDNPKLYAYNVRWLMAREGDLVMSDIGLAEKRVYHAALNGNNSLPSILHQKDD